MKVKLLEPLYYRVTFEHREGFSRREGINAVLLPEVKAFFRKALGHTELVCSDQIEAYIRLRNADEEETFHRIMTLARVMGPTAFETAP